MKRQRYIVVRYPVSSEKKHRVENGIFKDHLPIHELLHEYHWERLDDNFVLVTGEYTIGHHHMIMNHPHAHMLPSLGSGKKLYKHGIDCGKQEHTKALIDRFKLNETHSIADLLDELEGKMGPMLLPVR